MSKDKRREGQKQEIVLVNSADELRKFEAPEKTADVAEITDAQEEAARACITAGALRALCRAKVPPRLEDVLRNLVGDIVSGQRDKALMQQLELVAQVCHGSEGERDIRAAIEALS